jgi:GNAT superfamily N-acetyltransferase
VSYRFRPAEPRDRDAVFAICAHTWADGDYIPRLWDAWLADPEGTFAVGVDADGTVVALGKLSVPGPGEGWLEGLRVAPERRGGGWGRALTAHLTACAWAQGLRRVGFITEDANAPMHRVAAALGYVGEPACHPYRAEVGGTAPARLATADEAARLWDAAAAAVAPRVPLRWRRWTGATASAAWLAGAVAAGQVLVAADGRSLAVLAPPARDDYAEIALLAAAPAACPELLAAARARAATLAGAGRVLAMLPPFAAGAAEAAGWTHITRRPMWLYERERPE